MFPALIGQDKKIIPLCMPYQNNGRGFAYFSLYFSPDMFKRAA